MKHILTLALAVLAAVNLWGDMVKPKLTPEQIEERKYRHFGGHIYQPQQTKVVCIASDQDVVSGDVLMSIASEMQTILMLPVQVNAKSNVAVRLMVCKSDNPAPLMVLPDNAAAYINVKALMADNPSTEVLETRVCKELWRGLIYTLGGGNTYAGQCVMKQVSSLSELDAISARTACPDAFMRVAESAGKLGIKSARRATYRQACKEGWAPAPTNEVQQAIWDEVRKLPAKPLKIQFDPKKGR